MTILDIALCGVLAVSSAGLSFFRHPAPPQDVKPVVTENVAERVAVQEKPDVTQKPVQTVEERGDALLFEADALSSMPFGRAIVMPFD